jgi:hypothetical protein
MLSLSGGLPLEPKLVVVDIQECIHDILKFPWLPNKFPCYSRSHTYSLILAIRNKDILTYFWIVWSYLVSILL